MIIMRLIVKKAKYGIVMRCFFLAIACMLLIPLYSYADTKNGESSDVSDMPVHKSRLKTIIVDDYYPYTFVNQNGGSLKSMWTHGIWHVMP